ncbi:hypothetical protein A3K86_11880 [Photobacterium jeanii]|uniref:Peptidase S1 domain-containing protein n=2 Tax=Photobacterium jeanii TaxID=858640 RepID=A0A178KA70_9GAMM|nr:hypothetical protein A3K86_11880 [Photobacterium jeanii]
MCFTSLPLLASTPSVSPRIIGGITTQNDEIPWQVYLNISFPNDGTYVCGGVLVAQDVVLTAAHCLQNGGTRASADNIKVWAGINSIFSTTSSNAISVTAALQNSSYNASRFSNDIAILKLAQPAPANAKPILIATSDQQRRANSEFSNGYNAGGTSPENLLVSGWGSTSATGSSSATNLQQTLLTGVPDNTCSAQWGSGVNDSEADIFVCAITPSPSVVRDSCFGDSGGPLVWQDPQRAGDADFGLRLVGLVSFGDGCASSLPGVYTEVQGFVSWINQQTNNSLTKVATPTLSFNPFERDYSDAGKGVAPNNDTAPSSDGGSGGAMGYISMVSLVLVALFKRRRLYS